MVHEARCQLFRGFWQQVTEMPEHVRASLAASHRVKTIRGSVLSPFNAVLCFVQNRSASVVGDVRQWAENGRCVRKGAHGLMVWIAIGATPELQPDSTADENRFSIATVFDISETDPLPSPLDQDEILPLEALAEKCSLSSVPDIDPANAEKYQANLRFLGSIEHLANNRFRFEAFQRNDLARLAIPDAALYAGEAGTVKTQMGIAWALLKVGLHPEANGALLPAEPVLIVAPGRLFDQVIADYKALFGPAMPPVRRLNSQDTFLRLISENRGELNPGFYLSSYTEIASNGFQALPIVPDGTLPDNEARAYTDFFGVSASTPAEGLEICRRISRECAVGIGEERYAIQCVYRPALADLARHHFAAVVIDEGPRVTSEHSIMGRGLRTLAPRFRLFLTASIVASREAVPTPRTGVFQDARGCWIAGPPASSPVAGIEQTSSVLSPCPVCGWTPCCCATGATVPLAASLPAPQELAPSMVRLDANPSQPAGAAGIHSSARQGETEKPASFRDPDTLIKRERLTKLFEFLKAYTDLRYPPVRDINQQRDSIWLKDLPDYPSVELFRDTGTPEEETEDSEVVLRLTRPTITTCPPPPVSLSEWLKPGWRDFPGKIELENSRNIPGNVGKTRFERFEDDDQRRAQLQNWQRQREEWVTNENPARHTLTFFQKVYEWYGILEREGEKIDLMVGDGLLCARDAAGKCRHPVLLQKLELEFYPEKKQPQFVFRKRDKPPELYLDLLRVLPDVNNEQLARCADELKKTEFAPLGGDDTNGFLLRLIQGLFPIRGEFRQGAHQLDLETQTDTPTIERQPVIFMRDRRTGIFDAVLQDIARRLDFSPALLQILGLSEITPNPTETIGGRLGLGNEDEDILLSKPANREQLEIAKQLARRNCVLVQGPPGTGKTHTIANLLGHLLAHGKRVLVTAHTPKALRVLRQKVVEALQPLCISVLHNDKQSQDALQSSVRTIHLRLAEDDRLLEREALRSRDERKRILKALCDAREKFLDARQDEIRDVVFAGRAIRPIEAATRLKEGAAMNDWIPVPVALGESSPISYADVVALYQTNARISADDERELDGFRPDITALPTPKEFHSVIAELNLLAGYDLCFREELWDAKLEPEDLAEFDRMLEKARKTIEFLRDSAPWQLGSASRVAFAFGAN
jgi:hypothetical protein